MVPDNEHLHLRQAVRIGQHALCGGRHIARDQYIIFSRGHQCGKAAIARAGQDRRKQPQAAAEAPAPLIMQETATVESEIPAAAGSAEVPVSETEGSIPENLPEDEEDQFIDLSSEADATAALEAELSAEALKE